jgi:two-component system repressor protein LuxO
MTVQTSHPTTHPLLLIEDTPSLQMIYSSVLRKAGHVVECAGNAATGEAQFKSHLPRVVLLDLMLPDGDGLDLMRDMLEINAHTRVIVITANGSINKAVQAMRAGAHEFLVKPFDEQRLLSAVTNALHDSENPSAARATTPAPLSKGALPPFVGRSAPMQEIYDKIKSVSRSMATVFITGESGTGKELCAEAVHRISNRAQGPFIALNCGAIPIDLLESEVFGHLKGSFTGAISDKQGAAAAADGGTLFLDEVCEMDLNLQTKMLRFLQTSTVTPVGATKPRKVNVRIVCATNRDPLDAVRKGLFREDLYYRLHVVPIHMPPLRDRGNDIVEIAQTQLAQLAKEEGHEFLGLSPEVSEMFLRLPWPGNVRQLINVLRNVVVLNRGTTVLPEMLPKELWDRTSRYSAADPAPSGANSVAPSAPPTTLHALEGMTLAEIERLVIEAVLNRHSGSVPRAARELDVSPSTLYRKRESWFKDSAC